MARPTLSDRREIIEPSAERNFRARRLGVVLTAIAVVVTLIVVGVIASGARPALAQIRVRTGTVDVEHASKGFVRASDGSNITAGDDVRTSERSQGIVEFFDGSVSRLDQNSRLAVRTLADAKGGRRIGLALTAGRVWNRVKELTSPGDRFDLQLSKVVVSVRGTTYMADCRRPEGCYVVGFDGTTHLASTDGEETDVTVGGCELVASDGTLQPCDLARTGLLDEWVRSNLAEDQQLVASSATTTPTPTASPSETQSSSGGSAPRRVTRPPVRTPTKTAPPSTPAPTKDPNNDGSVPTPPPSPHHKPRGSANP